MAEVFRIRAGIGRRESKRVVDLDASLTLCTVLPSDCLSHLIIPVKVGEGVRKISPIFLLSDDCLLLVLQLSAVHVGSIASKSRWIESNGQWVATDIKLPKRA
jgi:hypothetical protein